MALPTINLKIENTIYGLADTGDLTYRYSPFQNLQDIETGEGLQSLRVKAVEAGIDISKPINLDIEDAYDGSANLIITDNINPVKLINSRFYLTDSSHYAVANRRGNLDTNIYTKAGFQSETSLVKTVKTVVGLRFDGVFDGGILPVGNYNFYFKLSDFDGNESDIVSESGQVVCYIGSVNNPSSIRGGQLNENSGKLVKFILSNLDLAYDYISIYYVRSTGDDSVENSYVKKIKNKIKITGSSTSISITGYEETEDLSINDINVRYANFDSAKTVASCQNMLFVGNTTNDYNLFEILEKYSLLVYPTLLLDSESQDIGYLNNNYIDGSITGNEYLNPENIYYKLGLWDEEIYRYGIVYILNNYTLSPEFNVRGIKELTEAITISDYGFAQDPKRDPVKYDDNYIIEGTNANAKGVFRVNTSLTGVKTFEYDSDTKQNKPIKPIGIKFNFHPELFTGLNTLDSLTKGFFIVRQKRIPNILAQGLSIATTNVGNLPTIRTEYNGNTSNFMESFLTNVSERPVLGKSIYYLADDKLKANALLCPEASIRKNIFSSVFNSSAFKLVPHKYQKNTTEGSSGFIKLDNQNNLFGLSDLTKINSGDWESYDNDLLLVQPETSIIGNKETMFSSKAGNAYEAWSHVDPINGNIEDLGNSGATAIALSNDVKKTRGVFNSYVGLSKPVAYQNVYYNIYNKDFSFTDNWKEYFKIRYNDSSQFYPVSDRHTWASITNGNTKELITYRGDCYINTYTHRVMWGFADPELPTNNRIVDKYTWFKNYKVKVLKVKTSNSDIVIEDTATRYSNSGSDLEYKKILPLFTYKVGDLVNDLDNGTDLNQAVILTPEAAKYKKYSEANGEFGYMKINRPDVNAVGLGHWVTFKICSNVNLALRDEDSTNVAEEALFNRKRGFYPYSSADVNNKLPDSSLINAGISNTVGKRFYFEIPEVPFIKTFFTTRIYNSNIIVDSIFQDGSRVFKSTDFQDYTMDHGQLTKLIEWKGTLLAVMEHGILLIPVNERAMMTNSQGENVYINTDNVLPKNPRVLSNMYGSIWSESVIKTQRFIYGIDTIARKIWRTDGNSLEIISDMKVQKFLNDHIDLKVSDRDESIHSNLIKTHYNAFKQDIIFTYRYGLEEWSLCYNELLSKWTTRYSWFPEFSENINNIFYTFASTTLNNQQLDTYEANYGKLFKHGFSGTYEEMGYIRPTVWYEEQHPFEFEFVVNEIQGVQKIFDNLKIISNKAEPDSLTFEVVGEGYDWYKYKEVISWMENHSAFNSGEITEEAEFSISENGYYLVTNTDSNFYEGYEYLLTHSMLEIETTYPDFPRPYGMTDSERFVKLPYIPKIKTQKPTESIDWDLTNYSTALVYDRWNGEDRVLSYQEGKSLPKYGRILGNMHYVEDSWDIQIQPTKLRYAFMRNNVLTFTEISEMRIRDKYIKIRVKYSGEKLAIITGIRTLFTVSYA